MKLNKNIKFALVGALVWVGVFIISVFLYDEKSKPIFDVLLTQNILFVVRVLFVVGALLFLFKDTRRQFVREGFVVGIIWIIVSAGLDFMVLKPLFNIPTEIWLKQILPSYVMMPILSIGIALAKRPAAPRM